VVERLELSTITLPVVTLAAEAVEFARIAVTLLLSVTVWPEMAVIVVPAGMPRPVMGSLTSRPVRPARVVMVMVGEPTLPLKSGASLVAVLRIMVLPGRPAPLTLSPALTFVSVEPITKLV
jgi:hypothetical protein